MKTMIWHNPHCSKSREALTILRETPGVEVEVYEYLKERPSRERIATMYQRAGITAHQGLRASEQLAKDLDLAHISEAAVLDAMAADPILIERPLVETERGVVLARPPERVREVL